MFTIDQLFQMMMGSEFEVWYENDFEDHVGGEEGSKSEKEIKKDLEQMLKSS